MGDRRAVSAGHHGASAMALTNEPWKVAVGGNRVENMTIEQIAYAFHAGQLNVRTPLWQPGTSGWQALGNFEQFLMQPSANDAHANGYNAEYGGGQYSNGLSQFEEADDDPTRMWTGAAEELPGMAPVPTAPTSLPPARPSARTGPRQVPSRAPAPAPRPVSASPTARLVTGGVVSSAEPRGSKRGNGVWLAAALVGLVGLGTAVLAARGNMSLDTLMGKSAPQPAPEPAAAPAEVAAAPAPVEAAVAATPAAAPAAVEPAKFEEASAFVAGAAGEKPAEAATAEPTKVETESDRPTASTAKARRLSARKSLSASRAEKAEKASSTEAKAKAEAKAEAETKAEAKEAKAEAEPASESKSANASVNQAAAAALASSATLASSCRPSGGPSGSGKARIIYAQDGSVASVEILTAKFRDTLTGSCVKMVFRRAKIPAFKGEAPTFIKSFTIPEE
jgi:hypothetical protein